MLFQQYTKSIEHEEFESKDAYRFIVCDFHPYLWEDFDTKIIVDNQN